MMTVDSIPNVRVCSCPASDGSKVEHQNAWPSLENDIFSIFDKLGFLFSAGFQYRRFIRPRFLWPIAERVIRRIGGLGRLPATEPRQSLKVPVELSPDVAVIGGGPAGMAAALQAGKLGAKTLLIDDGTRLGGRLRLQTSQIEGPEPWNSKRGFQIGEEMAVEISKFDNITVFLNSTAIGYYFENILAVETPENLLKIRPKKVIVATGCYDLPAVFYNNDLPGIFLPVGLQRLMHEYGVRPGSEGVVATNNEFGYELARNMADAGVKMKAICDERRTTTSEAPSGTDVLAESNVFEANGTKSLSGVRVKNSDNKSRFIPCDTMCVAMGTFPANELLFQLGCEMQYSNEARGHIPARNSEMLSKDNCYAVGSAAGSSSFPSAILEGTIAGAAACLSLGMNREVAASVIRDASQRLSQRLAKEED